LILADNRAKEPFGTLAAGGETVYQLTLENDKRHAGQRAVVRGHRAFAGCAVRRASTSMSPLGFDTLAEYEADGGYIGPLDRPVRESNRSRPVRDRRRRVQSAAQRRDQSSARRPGRLSPRAVERGVSVPENSVRRSSSITAAQRSTKDTRVRSLSERHSR
jgi:hypothetical protein